jgi:putative Holliday junction resolvase
MKPGRILAVDYGKRSVGLACCDETGIAVRPLPSIPNLGSKRLLARLRRLAEEGRIDALVVGLPLNMDGSAGELAREARQFMQALEGALGLPVIPVDERLSTVEAEQLWKGMGPRQRKKYRSADSLAAALILRRHLEESC